MINEIQQFHQLLVRRLLMDTILGFTGKRLIPHQFGWLGRDSGNSTMTRFTLKNVGMLALTLFVSFALVGCEPKGPAQQAGENIDKAGKDLKNAVDPRGPAEKAGDKLDKAIGNK